MLVKKRVKVFLIVSLLAIFCFNIMAMAADDLGNLKDQYGDTNDKIDDLKGQKGDIVSEIQKYQKDIDVLKNNISKVNNDIDDIQHKISTAQNNIDVATKKLNAAIEDYNKQDALMKERINALYKNGTTIGYIQIILSSTSLSDFLTRADIMERVINNDVQMLKVMKQKRVSINNQKVKLESDKKGLVALNSSLVSKKNGLEKQNAQLNVLVKDRNQKVAKLDSTIKAEQVAAEKIKDKISSIMAAKAAAEAAAKKAASSESGSTQVASRGVSSFNGRVYAILHRSEFPAGAHPYISSGYGSRVDPITGILGAFHPGIDISTNGAVNIPVHAMAPGTVIIAEWVSGYGNCVVIDHGNGLFSLYGHNNSFKVIEGQTVSGGQVVSLSGNTGRSTGPHVHFSVLRGGTGRENYINPSPYLLISD
ncbi:MAG: peptidoglycan DD-metalloendopeptidase family protein [Clostridiales bacterium]|nr:peptidoglycan DD-metalloendopeptidase family protein [Clostridiales bacterium]